MLGEQRADRAVDVLVVLVRVVGDRARLGEAVALLDTAAHAPLRLGLELGVEGRRAARDEAQAREVEVGDQRVLGQRKHDRRRDVAGRDAVLLDGREELREVEARHRDDASSAAQGVVEHEHLAVDVEERQDGDDAVVLADGSHRSYWQRLATRLRCVSITPLVSPVVPLENGSATTCVAGSIAGRGGGVPRGASSSSNGVVPGASPIEKTSSTPAA